MLQTTLHLLATIFSPALASAHEPYVLAPETVQSALAEPAFNIFAVLGEPKQLAMFLAMAAGLAVVALGAAWAARTPRGVSFRKRLESYEQWGFYALLVIAAVAALLAWRHGSFPGPETNAPWARGPYLLNYVGWLGVAFAIFFRAHAPVIVRVAHGFALIYAAISIKLLHPLLTLAVIERYNLAELPFFPHDPLFVLLGATLTELAIGFAILVGFEMRLALIAEAAFMTLAALYFTEPLWPHLILYGIALYLFVAPQRWALDQWIDRKI